MPRRCAVLALVGSVLLVGACTPAAVAPSAEPTTTTAVPTASPASPSAAAPSSASPSRSAGPSVPPSGSASASPAAFTTTIDNTWFPLVPGTTFTYRGTKDDKKALETFEVTSDTKVIDRVTCVVVIDTVTLAGVPAEKLFGYYAQDRDGSVWYFGEDMQELDASGHVVSTEGSWHAGVDKAMPALIMEGAPVVGHTFEHDATKSDFAVLSLASKVTVPFGSFTNALQTKEWSPVEPDVETRKFYVPDVGMVRDVAVKGPTEELVLVKVDHP